MTSVGVRELRLRSRLSPRLLLLTCLTSAGVIAQDGLLAAVALGAFIPAAALVLPAPEWILSKLLVVTAMLLVCMPLVLLVAPGIGASGCARATTALVGLTVIALGVCRRGTAALSASENTSRPIYTLFGLGGVVVILNSYLLRGSSGSIGLMDHDHVFHAAVINSALSSGMNPRLWIGTAPEDLLAVPSAVHWAVAAWLSRFVPETASLSPSAQVSTQVAVAAGAACLGWFGIVSAARAVGVRLQLPVGWAAAGLSCTLLGPFLWLRYQGMWPAILAAGCLALAASTAPRQVRSMDIWPVGCVALVPAVTCGVLGIQAWPVLALPLGLAVIALINHRRGTPRDLACLAGVGALTLTLGLAWSALTLRRSVQTLSGGVGGLGLPDWRLGVVAVLALVLASSLRASRQPAALSPEAGGVLTMAALTALVAVALDYGFSMGTGQGATYYSGKLGVVALLMATPVAVLWLSTVLVGDRGTPRAAWSLALGVSCLFAVSIWMPWRTDFFQSGSVGVGPSAPALMRTIVGDDALATDAAAHDSPMLACGVDGVIRWPGESARVGTFKYAAMWTAVASGRVDAASWAAVKDVYPPLAPEPVVDQQLGWFGLGGSTPRTVAWVVPDRDAYLLSERIGMTAFPEGVRVRVLSETQFAEALAQCRRSAEPA